MSTTCSCVAAYHGIAYPFCHKCFGSGEIAEEHPKQIGNMTALGNTAYRLTGEDKVESVILTVLQKEPQRCLAAIICMNKQSCGGSSIGYAAIGEYGTCPECQHEAKCMLDDIKGQM